MLTEIYTRLMDRFGLDNSTFNTHELIDFILSFTGKREILNRNYVFDTNLF